LQAISDGQPMLVSMLEAGTWSMDGNELVVQVGASPTVIDMSLSVEARRLIVSAASRSLGRSVKLRVIPGGTAAAVPSRVPSKGGGRGRAEQEPVVRRLQEKFGAEIRTIIDYREKK
jgi:hypothetical protein